VFQRPSGQSKISAQARGRLLLDFLEPNSLLIPSDPIPCTTKYNTIVDYFILPKALLHDVTHCTAYPDSWKNIPATITTPPANQVRKEKKLIITSSPSNYSSHPTYPHTNRLSKTYKYPQHRAHLTARTNSNTTQSRKHTVRIWKKQPEMSTISNISPTTLTTSVRRGVLTKHAT